jgi:type II secretory pathway component PulF
VAISLNHQSLFVEDKKPKEEVFSTFKGLTQFFTQSIRPVKSSELLFFTTQLALMLEIETPLNLSLKALRDQTGNRVFKEVLTGMLQDIEEGRQLSQAMKKHPKVFGSVYISMVAAGESGGFLKNILDRIAEILENRQSLMTQLRSALTYPVILCVVSILVIVFIMVAVLPKFTVFFMRKIELLPMTTRILMKTSAFLQSYWWLLILSGLVLITGLVLFLRSRRGQNAIDWLLVNLPLIGGLANKIYISQFLRILGHLMESQVPLIEALDVTRGIVRNRYFRRLIDRIKIHVREGGKFSQPFADYPHAPESVKQMISTGEEAGNLSKVMLRLADFFDTEVEKDLKNLSAMIEPMALIVMGVVIGLIVSSVILPLFKLAHVMR